MSSSASRQPHDVLGVSRAATRDEVQRAFRVRARELHPDVSGGDTTSDMAELSAARDAMLRHARFEPPIRATPRSRPITDDSATFDGEWDDYWSSWWSFRSHE
jgi:curved DNA-binding protein CbpA